MKKKEKIRYYRLFSDDFVETKEQEKKLSSDYQWVRKGVWSKFLSSAIYFIAFLLSSVYCRVFLHVRFVGRKKLKEVKKTGAFLYGNHTQPIGDVFNPALACIPTRIYTIVNPSNLGIPFLGRILPYLGALPVPDTLQGMKKLNEAIEYRLEEKKCIVVYPEAHVWEYYTGIRPFTETSFRYPVKWDKPTFTFTTTYQKRRMGKRPRITIYIDGPFYADKEKTTKEQIIELRDKVYETLKERATFSNYEYIRYLPAEQLS